MEILASGIFKLSNFQINTLSNQHIIKSIPLLHLIIKPAETIDTNRIFPEKVAWEA